MRSLQAPAPGVAQTATSVVSAGAPHRDSTSGSAGGVHHPFDLRNRAAYHRWRDRKLEVADRTDRELVVELRDPLHLSDQELGELRAGCRARNYAIYAGPALEPAPSRTMVAALARQLGLRRLDRTLGGEDDGIASIRVRSAALPDEYVPYTARPINWHTDGYYNEAARQVHGIIMHCVSCAPTGGDNELLDPEIVYIGLRDQDPGLVAALMRPSAMTIPANVQGERTIRPARSGPVFSVARPEGTLHMRYTARKRHVEWHPDACTGEAAESLRRLISAASPHVRRVRLQPGQGIVCNNALHTRGEFADAPGARSRRLHLRARYLDRVQDT